MNGLQPPVHTTANLVHQRLADRRPRSIARERADVNKEFATAARGSDETETAIVVPGLERAFHWHLQEA
jgi:hypothetical protein